MNKKLFFFGILIILSLISIVYAGQSSYNSHFTAPYCADGASPCIASSVLLKCRNSVNDGYGPEPNEPNTIDSCTDGTGTYSTPSCGGDESVENITIIDYNNSIFTYGDTIGVKAVVHCYDTNDHLALIYSNDSSAGTLIWKQKQYIASCPSAGYNTIYFDNFTLDNIAGNHSVRVWINYDSSQDTGQTCASRSSGTNYADNDDVAFLVVTPNQAPTIPTNITCNGINCNGTFYNNVELNCSGSIDADGDDITYVIDALYNNKTIIKNITDFSFSVGERGVPDTTLSLFMMDYSGPRNRVGDGVVDGDEFGERPPVMNCYGGTSQKCTSWNCTGWSSSSTSTQIYCASGWVCKAWNQGVCDQWDCPDWQDAPIGGTSASAYVCSGGWDCNKWNGTVCTNITCAAWQAGTPDYDYVCTGGWNCSSWHNGKCSEWDCLEFTQPDDKRDDIVCTGSYDCQNWLEGDCGLWNCTLWESQFTNREDEYCTGGWNCSEWHNEKCDKWDCLAWSNTGTNDRDMYCTGGWNCSNFNTTSGICSKWDCLEYSAGADAVDTYCSGEWDCVNWATVPESVNVLNETASFWVYYNDLDGDYYLNITNISVKVEIDSYTPEASVKQSTNYPDLQLEIYNGTNWIEIGNFSLNNTYTGTGLQTENNNFTLTTNNPTILSAWQTPSNQDIRIRAIGLDSYNVSLVDEINYTNLWVEINGKAWTEIGNHSESTTYHWNLTPVAGQTGIDFKCKAIDLNGSNKYSNNFIGGFNFSAGLNTPPLFLLNSPKNNSYLHYNWALLNITSIDNDLDNTTVFFFGNGNLINTSYNNPNASFVIYNWSGLNNGLNNWSVVINDGLVNTTSKTYLFYKDTFKPIASFGLNPVDTYNTSSQSIKFELKCSDNLNVNTLQIFGNWKGSWVANATNLTPINDSYWNITLNNLPEGTWNWAVFCNDSAGNSDITLNRSFHIDLTPPISNSPLDASYSKNSQANIAWVLKDEYAPGNYVIMRNGTVQNSTTAWINNTNLNVFVNTSVEGVWNYTINFNDSVGNNGVIDSVLINITPLDGEFISPINLEKFMGGEIVQIIFNETFGQDEIKNITFLINGTIYPARNNTLYGENYWVSNWTVPNNLDSGTEVIIAQLRNAQGKILETKTRTILITPRLDKINLSAQFIKAGEQIVITAINESDPNNGVLYLYCINDNDSPNETNNDCTDSDPSFPYDLSCGFNTPIDSANHTIFCVVKNVNYYSKVQNASYITDSTPPLTTIDNIAGDTTPPYYDSTDNSNTNITINGEIGMLCRWDESDQTWSSIGAIGHDCIVSEAQATCMLDVAQGTTNYYVSCRDSLGNEQNTSQNLDIDSLTVDWTAPNTSDDWTSGIKIPPYNITIIEDDNIPQDPITFYCKSTSPGCVPSIPIDDGEKILFNSSERGTYYVVYNSSDYVGNMNSVSRTVQINQLPILMSAKDNSTIIKGGSIVNISTISSDLDSHLIKLYVCNSPSATSSGCTDIEYCNSNGNANLSCSFASEKDTKIHYWYAFIYDLLNESAINNPINGTYTTDFSAPGITIISPDNLTYYQNSITAYITTNESAVSAWYNLDNNQTNNVSMSNVSLTEWSKVITSLNVGQHNISFWVNDTFGNIRKSEIRYFTISAPEDVTKPSIIILSPANKSYHFSDVLINITSNEDLKWAGYRLDGGNLNNLDNASLRNWKTTLTNLTSETTYTLVIFANDTSDNQANKTIVFYYDSSAPRFFQVNAFPNPTNVSVPVKCSTYLNDTYNITSAKISENSLGNYENHSVDISGTHGWLNYTILGSKLTLPGTYFCNFYTKDIAGNSNSTSISFNVNDVTPPMLTVFVPDEGYTYNQENLTLSLITNENASSVWFNFNNSAINQTMNSITLTSWNYNLTSLPNADYNITFWANDTFGNIGTSGKISFTINLAEGDTIPPVITIDTISNKSYQSSTSLQLNITSNENLKWAGYRLNGGNLTTMANTSLRNWNSPLIGLGNESTNILIIYANDTSDNQANKTIVFYVDILAPRYSNNKTNPSFANESEDVTCSIYWNDTFNLTSVIISEDTHNRVFENHTIDFLGAQGWANYTMFNLDKGHYECIFYAKDSAGNSNSTSTRFSVYDVTAPEISINSPLNQNYSTNNILLSITTNENCDEANYSFDNGVTNFSLEGGPTLWTKNIVLNDGAKIVKFWAKDSSGNIGIANISFIVDTSVTDITPPTITIWSPLNNSYNINGNVLFNITTNENLSWAGWSNNSGLNFYTLGNTSKTNWNSIINFTQGTYWIIFYANDTSTNKNQANKTIKIYVDLANPSVDDFVCVDSNDSQDVVCVANVSDTLGLNYAIISNNANGTWVNSSNINLAGIADTINYNISSFLTSPGSFNSRIYLFDNAGRANSSAINIVNIFDDTAPIVNNITFSPNTTQDLDPGIPLNVVALITEDYNISSVNLMYKEFGSSYWNFIKMTNNSPLVIENSSVILYNASNTFTNGTWIFRINATDSQGNSGFSNNYTFIISNDTTYENSTTIPFIKSITYSQRKSNNSIGYLRINNTGDTDLNFSINISSSIANRFNLNYTNKNNANYFIPSGNNLTLLIQLNTTGLTAGLYNYTLTGSSDAGIITYSRQINIQTSASAYLNLDIITYPISVTKGEKSINLVSRVQNLGSQDAQNTWLNWTLPFEFTLISGNLNRNVGNLPIGSIATNSITISVISSASNKKVNITSSASSDNSDSVINMKTITIGNPSVIIVPSTSSSGGSSSGGGIISGGGAEQVEYSKEIEIVRGKDDSFDIQVKNNYDSSILENLVLNIQGFLSQYITIVPKEISKISPGNSKNFTVNVKAPFYKEAYEEHDLIATIKGKLITPSTTKDYTEIQKIKLIIQEISRDEANFSLIKAEKAIQQMIDSNFYVKNLLNLLKEAKLKLSLRRNKESYDLSQKIIQTKKIAFEADKLIKNLQIVLDDPRKIDLISKEIPKEIKNEKNKKISLMSLFTGHAIFEDKNVKDIVDLAIAAFERGDYETALERAKSAQVLLLLETKGNVFLFVYLYWPFILFSIMIFSFTGVISYRGYRKSSIINKIEDLNKRENKLKQIIERDQRKYFTGKISSNEFYRSMHHAQERLAKIKKIRLTLRNKRLELLKPERINLELEKERRQVEKEIKRIQKEFYLKGKITEPDYKFQFKILNERLAEIEGEKTSLDLIKTTGKLSKKRFLKEVKKSQKRINRKNKIKFFFFALIGFLRKPFLSFKHDRKKSEEKRKQEIIKFLNKTQK